MSETEKIQDPAVKIRDEIVEAAIRRFSYFGVNKTTLSEIADDLSLPRHSLLHCFHDKLSLVSAVEEKVITEYEAGLNNILRQNLHAEESLQQLSDLRLQFFEKYFMLALQGEAGDHQRWSGEAVEVISKIKLRELALVTRLLEEHTSNAEENARIIIDTLSAYEMAFKHAKPLPTKEDFIELGKKEKAVIDLCIYGLMDRQTG